MKKTFLILSSLFAFFMSMKSFGVESNTIATQSVGQKSQPSIDSQIIENQPIENFLISYENGGVVQGKSGKRFLIIDLDSLKNSESNKTWLYKVFQSQGINLTYPGVEYPPPQYYNKDYPGVEYPPPQYYHKEKP